jgi:hypothetical protein
LTPSGNRGKWETPQAEPRRLPSLPEESKFPQRKPRVITKNNNLAKIAQNYDIFVNFLILKKR